MTTGAPRLPLPKPGTRPRPDYDRDGNPVCRLCKKPNRPGEPLSAYCDDCTKKVHSDTQRRSRTRKKDAEALVTTTSGLAVHEFTDDYYSGPTGIVLLPAKADDLLVSLATLVTAASQARSVTDGLSPGNTAEFYLGELKALVEAVEDLNEVLGPVLRRSR